MSAKVCGLRLLPWSGEDGKAAYLAVGDGDASFMSRLADGVEAVQLGMATDLLDWVADFDTHAASAEELRGLVGSLSESLRDVIRVADSRGARLTPTDDDRHAAAAWAVVEKNFTLPSTIQTPQEVRR